MSARDSSTRVRAPFGGFSELCAGGLVDGRYSVRRAIARGGMGLVHEAEHAVLGSLVALKTLTTNGLASPSLCTRLLREGRILTQLDHPGIVRALDAGECPTYGPYLALERIGGRSVDGMLATRRQLPVRDVVALAAQLGAALAHAHGRGVVHRDVKPSNVMVAPTSRGEIARLIDFGVATAHEGEPARTGKLTHAGCIVGTVEYLAPELLLEGGEAGVASDVYALGAMLYECLMGDVPIRGTARAIVQALATDTPIPSLRERRVDVPDALDVAIRRALRRDPHARWSSAALFGEACLAAVPDARQGLSLLAPPPAPESETRRFDRAPFVSPVRMITGTGVVDGRAEDISERGLLVVTDAAVSEGHELFVRFPLPISGRVVTCHARARWTRTRHGQKAVGLELASLSEDVRQDIRRYVEMMGVGVPETDVEHLAA